MYTFLKCVLLIVYNNMYCFLKVIILIAQKWLVRFLGCVACIRLCFIGIVKCSNEGGPGPRYNMKEIPGSSTLTMLVVYVYHLYLMPLFSEAGDEETSSVGLPPPPPEQPGQSPLPPPSGTYSTPCKEEDRGQARWKSHFSLWFEVGGHRLG